MIFHSDIARRAGKRSASRLSPLLSHPYTPVAQAFQPVPLLWPQVSNLSRINSPLPAQTSPIPLFPNLSQPLNNPPTFALVAARPVIFAPKMPKMLFLRVPIAAKILYSRSHVPAPARRLSISCLIPTPFPPRWPTLASLKAATALLSRSKAFTDNRKPPTENRHLSCLCWQFTPVPATFWP
jgi:hypothetical protein